MDYVLAVLISLAVGFGAGAFSLYHWGPVAKAKADKIIEAVRS